MIKVIAFDYGGVIGWGPIMRWLLTNIPPEDKRYKLYMEQSMRWDAGEIDKAEAYQIMSEILGFDVAHISNSYLGKTNLRKGLDHWLPYFEKSKPDENIINLIKKLKKNYKIILFSNFIGEILRDVLIKHKIKELFDEILISSEYKMKKPDPRFFKILVELAGVKKNEILFIDDRKENIDGAIKFGIKGIVFENVPQLIKALGVNEVKA